MTCCFCCWGSTKTENISFLVFVASNLVADFGVRIIVPLDRRPGQLNFTSPGHYQLLRRLSSLAAGVEEEAGVEDGAGERSQREREREL